VIMLPLFHPRIRFRAGGFNRVIFLGCRKAENVDFFLRHLSQYSYSSRSQDEMIRQLRTRLKL
jgi:hypothetical protein